MIAARRTRSNFALERAIALAREFGRPLLVLEALERDYPWASERLHRFVIDGMREQSVRFAPTPIGYYPYVEPEAGAGAGLLEALADDACAVVTDDSPAFFLPRVVEAAGRRLEVALEAVDSNGLLPLRAADRAFTTAHSFRRWLQRELPAHLEAWPRAFPLRASGLPSLSGVPAAIRRRWPPASGALLRGAADALARLDLDRSVPATERRGGSRAARSRLRAFVDEGLPRYLDARHPDAGATSGLSADLHFGHISTHEVFEAVAEVEAWTPAQLADRADGRREGWWGMTAAAEAFLDELITWRELAYNGASHLPNYERYESLPEWARETLLDHASDSRDRVYTLEELAAAATHDEVWNAAQRQLQREGAIDGYLRMLWGKKILEWSATPQQAFTAMVELNNRYALDGRDPNSYAGIAWVLGRYDRAWGPERPIFGKVRYMSSEQARRKLRMGRYLERFAASEAERA